MKRVIWLEGNGSVIFPLLISAPYLNGISCHSSSYFVTKKDGTFLEATIICHFQRGSRKQERSKFSPHSGREYLDDCDLYVDFLFLYLSSGEVGPLTILTPGHGKN